MKMIKYNILSILLLCLLYSPVHIAQMKYSGTWKGFQVSGEDSTSYKDIYYLDFVVINGLLDGRMRKEQNGNKHVDILQIKGKKKYINIEIEEIKLMQSSSKTNKTDLNSFTFTYNLDRGYLEGYNKDTLSSGKIILFKTDYEFSSKLKSSRNRNWVESNLADYNKGLSSPQKRLEELKNFTFEPIYFDYDKDIIKEEFHEELYKIKKMVLSHSDLRILVIGHTDSDGSDQYNHSLSKRRAESIIRFFTKNGLRRDRIVIDFKGESSPADTNQTSEGRSKNRRVDFKFI